MKEWEKNAPPGHNSVGTPMSHRGYVTCQACGKDVPEISKETAIQYAYHVSCRPSSINPKEVLMPAVPKPSQAKRTTTAPARVRKPRAKATASAPEAKPAAATPASNGHGLTAEEAAKKLDVTIWRIRDLVRAGSLKSHGDSWRTGIDPISVEAYETTRGKRKQKPAEAQATA